MILEDSLRSVGQFSKPHGIKGEISLITQIGVSDGNEYVVCKMDGILVPFFIESKRWKSDNIQLLKLCNIDDEKAAKKFIGIDAFIPKNEGDKDDDDEITWDDLIGFEVVDDGNGNIIGNIIDIDDSTANVLCKLSRGNKEYIIPLANELITEVDVANKRLCIILPDGLMDL